MSPQAPSAATRVAVCQLRPRFGDVTGNRQHMTDAVTHAAINGARLVVLPELMTSGYVFTDSAEARRLAEPVDGETVAILGKLAKRFDLVLVTGLPELDQDTLYNTAVLVDRTGLRAVYRKVHLWDEELEIFTPGDQPPPVVQTDVGNVGVVVCYDLEFPEWMRLVALAGAEIVAAPTNWPREPRTEPERPIEIVRVQASASVNRIFVAVADRVGTERGVDWVGGSAILGVDGYPLALTENHDAEQVLFADCSLQAARDKRLGARNDVFKDRRPDLYRPMSRPASQ